METVCSKLDHLPNEVLFQIVSMLDVDSIVHFSRTCRRFCAIATDPLLWSDLTWKSTGKSLHEKNLRLALSLSKKALKKLSLTSYGKPLFLSKVLRQIQACKQLHSVSLTNFRFTLHQIKLVVQIPSLMELYIDSESPCLTRGEIFAAIASTNSHLKVLSIGICICSLYVVFESWVDAGFVPPDFRVVSSNYYKTSRWLRLVTQQEENHSPVQHEACLSIYQPISEFVSHSSDPVMQVHFSPPSMNPSVNFLNSDVVVPFRLALTEEIVGSNFYSGAIFFPDCINDKLLVDAPSEYITSLHLSGILSSLTSVHLQAIAVACPNLIQLDLTVGVDTLSDLNGLDAIASFCSKLQSLNLNSEKGPTLQSINKDRLWRVIGGMGNLTVLKIPCNLIPIAESVPVLFPTLKAIHVHRHDNMHLSTRFVDKDFKVFTSMPSLRYFRFDCVPSITVFSEFSNFLHSVNLTHLYIRKSAGMKLTLPPEACCYRNLESMYLCCEDFIFSDGVAEAVSKCERLKVLALKIHYISVGSIKSLFDSLTSLCTFYIWCTSKTTFPTERAAKALSKALLERAKSQGRIVDVLLTHKCVALLNSVQHRMYFNF